MKVVIDTNIWISAFIGKRLVGLAGFLQAGQFQVLSSQTQVTELFAVLQRPKLAPYFSPDDRRFIQRFFLRTCTILPIGEHVQLCRDPKDDFLLDIAFNGKIDYLVTSDQDLLVLGSIGQARIISYKDFEVLLHSS